MQTRFLSSSQWWEGANPPRLVPNGRASPPVAPAAELLADAAAIGVVAVAELYAMSLCLLHFHSTGAAADWCACG